jgi:cytochrome c
VIVLRINALASLATLTLATAACSGGETEPVEERAVAAQDAVTKETPAIVEATEETAETATTAGDPMTTKDGVTYDSLTGDAAAGRVVFAQCRACHETKEDVNKSGPSLAGIVGRKAGSVDGFSYSDANANSGLTWSEEQLYVYLEDPQRTVPKTKMIFPRLAQAQDRADVIAYLKDPS